LIIANATRDQGVTLNGRELAEAIGSQRLRVSAVGEDEQTLFGVIAAVASAASPTSG
jgi:hypothetical protein